MKFSATLLLVVIALLLGGFYFLYQLPRAEAKKAAAEFEKRFFHADPKEIVSIRVENKDGSVDISHGPQGWLIERPQRYNPDEGMIKKLLDTITAGQLIKIVGGAGDLSQFGFNNPMLSLTLGIGARNEVLVIGQKNPTDTGYYAYAEGLGKVFLVNKELPEQLYMRLSDLREKRLYPAILPEQIGEIVIIRGKETVDLVSTDGAWRMRSPISAKVGDEEMEVLLTALTQLKAEAFIPWERKFEALPQRIRLRLFDQGGRHLAESDVYYQGTGADEGIVVHDRGAVEAARTRRDFWELLQRDASDLMERHLFSVDTSGVTKISIVTGSERIMIEREENHWLNNGKRFDPQKAQILLDTLRNWKGTKLVGENRSLAKAHTIIEVTHGGGVAKLIVTDTDMSREMAHSLPTFDADVKAVTYRLAKATSLDRNVLVSSHEIDRFLDQARQSK